ncbi:uncharacterized protein LOC111691016 [Lucilia cuprina]|uniref:uncharacterized protein LOC111691016 n=1 Tax=Lucilia cuprina TaxID=7375 RepID=UPI000C71B9EE|nr:uncharacterized protein LOC111691016 [Lucilia cuprina]XP_023309406.1 uncharacterized protein LOC111691016 [Lucilia cuprina]XP_046806970.1 uncharacterized protein LOC111691016 [Lucilia cuprina]
MSNTGVNTGFAKCFIFFMAVVILLQGAVYLGLSIWGITLRQCSKETTDISSKPFQFAMDLIYFMNEDCGSPSVTVSDLPQPITLDVDFNKAEPVENRTFIFMITYAVISTLWVVTSLTIITTLCGPVTKTINGLCFWPWFLVIMAGCILDVVATGYHIHDIINTTSVEKTFKYLSIGADEKVIDVLSNFDAYFITPAVVMTCISSRVILIWLLNIFGSSFCLSLSNTLSKRNSSKQVSINSLATTSTVPVTSNQQLRQEITSVRSTQENSLKVEKVPKPELPSLQIHNIQRQSSLTSPANQSSRPYSVQSPNMPMANIYPTAPSSNESQATNDMATTYRNTESHPDRLNYPLQRNTSQYQQELSPISPLNNRYSTTNDSFQFSMQNQRVSEELRGQLPWSYTSMPPPVPKKTQMHVYPEIPAPDYGH